MWTQGLAGQLLFVPQLVFVLLLLLRLLLLILLLLLLLILLLILLLQVLEGKIVEGAAPPNKIQVKRKEIQF